MKKKKNNVMCWRSLKYLYVQSHYDELKIKLSMIDEYLSQNRR